MSTRNVLFHFGTIPSYLNDAMNCGDGEIHDRYVVKSNSACLAGLGIFTIVQDLPLVVSLELAFSSTTMTSYLE